MRGSYRRAAQRPAPLAGIAVEALTVADVGRIRAHLHGLGLAPNTHLFGDLRIAQPSTVQFSPPIDKPFPLVFRDCQGFPKGW